MQRLSSVIDKIQQDKQKDDLETIENEESIKVDHHRIVTERIVRLLLDQSCGNFSILR